MNILNRKDINKGSIISEFDLEFENWGITIRSCKLMKNQKGEYFISMPSRMYEDKGEKKYYNLVTMTKDFHYKLKDEIITKLNLNSGLPF